jgi:hypothetical protein
MSVDPSTDVVSTEELWALLSEEQREKFMKALQAPTSELAQQLLASEELDQDLREPWWKNTDAEEHRPKMPPAVEGPSLVYNIFAIRLVFALPS